jgi:signal transduction histidine kinase
VGFCVAPLSSLLSQIAGYICVAVGAAVCSVGMLTWLRNRQDMESRSRVRRAERERIARDLHDTVLQSMQGVLFRVQTWAADDTLALHLRMEIADVAEQARLIALDARDRIEMLRRTATKAGEIDCELKSLRQTRATESTAPQFCFEVLGRPRDLTPETHATVVEVAREAVRNAYRHARAAHINVILNYGNSGLAMTVVDDGKGIAIAEGVTDSLSNTGRFGLLGMQERAALLGAQLAIERNELGGCRIRLQVPSALAYGSDADSKRIRSWVHGQSKPVPENGAFRGAGP